jgi:SET domain-containing protein
MKIFILLLKFILCLTDTFEHKNCVKCHTGILKSVKDSEHNTQNSDIKNIELMHLHQFITAWFSPSKNPFLSFLKSQLSRLFFLVHKLCKSVEKPSHRNI